MIRDESSFEGRSAATAALAHSHWAFWVRGIAAILFGILALLLPIAALFSLLLLFAAYLVVDGVFAIAAAVRAFREHHRWGLFILEGIVDLVLAAGIILLPVGAALTFVFMAAGWAIVTGVLMMIASFRLHHRWWMFLGGLVSLLWGIALIIAPLLGALVLTWWIAGYAFVFGVSLIMAAIHLRRPVPAIGTLHPLGI